MRPYKMALDNSWLVSLLVLLPVLINGGTRAKNYQKTKEFIIMLLHTTSYQRLSGKKY